MEKAVLFGDSRTLVGIVTEPAPGAAATTALLFLNAGVVHRVGPNRIHVTAARRLAADGFLSVRFDLSGLGDSEARRDSLPFEEAAVLEVRDVMGWVQREYGIARFVLAGLCSGAVVSFRAALADDRVAGAVLINPQGFVQSTEFQTHVVKRAQVRQYWTQKLFRLESWRRALTGRSDYGHLAGVVRERVASIFRRHSAVSRIADHLSGEFDRLRARGVRLLLACSEGDLGLDYLNIILGDGFSTLDTARLRTVLLPPGDHSLTLAETQDRFFAALREWAAPWSGAPAARPGIDSTHARLEAGLSPTHAPLRS